MAQNRDNNIIDPEKQCPKCGSRDITQASKGKVEKVLEYVGALVFAFLSQGRSGFGSKMSNLVSNGLSMDAEKEKSLFFDYECKSCGNKWSGTE